MTSHLQKLQVQEEHSFISHHNSTTDSQSVVMLILLYFILIVNDKGPKPLIGIPPKIKTMVKYEAKIDSS